MSLASGHELVPLEGKELARQEKDWQGYTEGLVRLLPGRWLFPATFKTFADKYYNFEIRSDDVVLLTWPKCGTTWLQETVWTMRNNPDLDHPMAGAPVNARIPFLEMDILLKTKNVEPIGPDHPLMEGFQKMCPGKDPANGVFLQMADCSKSPRTFKSHLPLSLLPSDMVRTAKVVYMARNPKDAVVSFFHHCRIFKNHDFKGTFEEFVQYFLDDDYVYGPYWLHLKEAWKHRSQPNLHFMFFEDLKENTMEELKKLDAFLGTNLSQEQLEKVAHYTSFPEMKARDALLGKGSEIFFNADIINKDGGFFRKGKVGDWKGKYTPELEAKMDRWITTNLADFGIEFRYGV